MCQKQSAEQPPLSRTRRYLPTWLELKAFGERASVMDDSGYMRDWVARIEEEEGALFCVSTGEKGEKNNHRSMDNKTVLGSFH